MATIHYNYWDHNEAEVVKYLDSLSDQALSEYLITGKNVHDIKNEVEKAFNSRYQEKMGTVVNMFDYMTDDEFQEYLSVRFHCRFEEIIETVLISRFEEVTEAVLISRPQI